MHSFLASSPPRARDVTPTSSIERSVAIRFCRPAHARTRAIGARRTLGEKKKKKEAVGRSDG
jgi:hypothetical protein